LAQWSNLTSAGFSDIRRHRKSVEEEIGMSTVTIVNQTGVEIYYNVSRVPSEPNPPATIAEGTLGIGQSTGVPIPAGQKQYGVIGRHHPLGVQPILTRVPNIMEGAFQLNCTFTFEPE
jgi:hypothetical protein